MHNGSWCQGVTPNLLSSSDPESEPESKSIRQRILDKTLLLMKPKRFNQLLQQEWELGASDKIRKLWPSWGQKLWIWGFANSCTRNGTPQKKNRNPVKMFAFLTQKLWPSWEQNYVDGRPGASWTLMVLPQMHVVLRKTRQKWSPGIITEALCNAFHLEWPLVGSDGPLHSQRSAEICFHKRRTSCTPRTRWQQMFC